MLTESVNAANVEVATGFASTDVVMSAITEGVSVAVRQGSITVKSKGSDKAGATDGKFTSEALIWRPV